MVSRRALLHVALFVAFAGAAYAIFARLALRGFPFSGDEYSTVLQAEIFARGQLRAPAPAHAELLRVDHVVIDDWVRSKYPPGAAALLSLGVRAGLPWLVTPLEGALALVFAWWSARAVFGDKAAWVTLVVLGVSPLYVFQAASFYSHTAATMWLAAALAALTWWTRTPSERQKSIAMILVGAAIGCAFVTRPLDAVLFGAALLSLRSVRALVFAGLGGAPLLGLHFAYQAAVFGSPLTDGYHLYAPTFRAIYGDDAARSQIALGYVVDVQETWNHLDIVRAFSLDWTVPGCVMLAILGWFATRGQAPALLVRRFVGVFIVLFLLVFCFTMAGKDDGARPRYLSTVLLGVAWLSGPGALAAAEALVPRLGRRVTIAVAAGVLVLPAIQLGAFLDGRLPAQSDREGLFDEAQAQDIHGVMVVRTEFPTRFARNGPFFDGPVLYVSAPKDETARSLSTVFPGKAIYEARECWGDSPTCHHHWKITRVVGSGT